MATTKTLSKLLNEYFAVGFLPEPEAKKYYLISRYENKVSKRLLEEKKLLYEKGSKAHTDFMVKELTRGDYLLKKIKKNNKCGSYIPVPFKLG